MGCGEQIHPRVKDKFNGLVALFTISVCIGIAMIVLLIVFGTGVVRGRIRARDFPETNCTALKGTIGSDITCSCGKHCTSSFPCVQVYVNYTLPAGEQSYGPYIVHRTCDNLRSNPECSANQCEGDRDRNKEEIMEFYNGLLGKNSSFPCFYNPKELDEVIVGCDQMIIHYLLWPSVILVLFTGLSVVFFKLTNRKLKESRKLQADEKLGAEHNANILASRSNFGHFAGATNAGFY